jgi:hypothetical protein
MLPEGITNQYQLIFLPKSAIIKAVDDGFFTVDGDQIKPKRLTVKKAKALRKTLEAHKPDRRPTDKSVSNSAKVNHHSTAKAEANNCPKVSRDTEVFIESEPVTPAECEYHTAEPQTPHLDAVLATSAAKTNEKVITLQLVMSPADYETCSEDVQQLIDEINTKVTIFKRLIPSVHFVELAD